MREGRERHKRWALGISIMTYFGTSVKCRWQILNLGGGCHSSLYLSAVLKYFTLKSSASALLKVPSVCTRYSN